MPCDVAKSQDLQNLATRIQEEWGALDGLYLNFALMDQEVMSADVAIDEADEETWRQIIEVNLIGVMRSVRALLPLLSKGDHPSVVFAASDAVYIGESVRPAYAASKAGVTALMRHVATGWGSSSNLRSNAIASGVIMTEALKNNVSQAFLEETLLMQRRPEFGTPKDVAELVAFLLSKTSLHISGQVIHVNGGSDYF